MIFAVSLLLRVIVVLALGAFLARTLRHLFRLLRGLFSTDEGVPEASRGQAVESPEGPRGAAVRPSIPRAEILPSDAAGVAGPARGPQGIIEYISGPGAHPGERVRIYGMAMVGRIADNDIVVEDPGVSPRHAVIELIGGGFEIRDLDSASGTYVNGVQATGPVHLNGGEIIRVGCTELRFM